jgi:hypothetical protein
MPVIVDAVSAEGPMVNVEIGWSHHTARTPRLALRPIPPPLAGRAVLDTGAEVTCADPAFVRNLGLPFAGVALLNLPAHGGLSIASRAEASLTIVHPSGNPADNLVLPHLSVMELALAGIGYEVLIGREVLAKCRLLYNGPRNRFRLAY